MATTKKLIIVGTVLLLVALRYNMWANVADNPAESISEGFTGQPAGLEKNLPTEEMIPTH